MPLTPKLKSWLIADMVFRQDNGKWCIVGIFDRIHAQKYPIVHASLGLFMQVTDAEGEYDVGVEFRDAADRVLSVLPRPRLTIKDRLAVVGFGVHTRQLMLPSPGKYRFCLSFNGEFIHDIPLEAVLVDGGQNG